MPTSMVFKSTLYKEKAGKDSFLFETMADSEGNKKNGSVSKGYLSECVIRVQDVEEQLPYNQLLFIKHLLYAAQLLRITHLEDL